MSNNLCGTPSLGDDSWRNLEFGAKIEAVIEASPFSREGYRKVYARLRADSVRKTVRRARRIMRESSLFAPQRLVNRE